MMRVIVLYGPPADPAAFDAHYREIHVPLVRKMPHLKGFESSTGPVSVSDDGVAYHMVAMMTYATAEELEASMGSPEGEAAVADVANFASGGVRIVTVETEDWL